MSTTPHNAASFINDNYLGADSHDEYHITPDLSRNTSNNTQLPMFVQNNF